MSCDSSYEILDLFMTYGQNLQDIILFEGSPYRTYRTREEYDEDLTSETKGMIVWDQENYYCGLADKNKKHEFEYGYGHNNEEILIYSNDISFFVLIEFDEVEISHFDSTQIIVVSFDFNVSPDYDPTGYKQLKLISWFLKQHEELIEKQKNYLPSGRTFWVRTKKVSKGIPSQGARKFKRKSVVIEAKYCHCR